MSTRRLSTHIVVPALILLAGMASSLASGASWMSPLAPSNVAADAERGGRVLVTWQDNSDAELGYHIQREPAFPEGTVTVQSNTTQFEDHPGRGGFSYTITAFDNDGDSAPA